MNSKPLPDYRSTFSGMALLRHSGFTMIELLVVLAIVGILAAIALPNLQGTLRANRIKGNSAALRSDIAYARNEAARRRDDVTLCPLASTPSGGNANYSCATDGTTWSGGWIVYSGVQNGTHEVTAAQVFRVRNDVGQTSISVPNSDAIGSTAMLVLNSLGGARQTGTFSVCGTGSSDAGKQGLAMFISLSGQISSSTITC